jgi:hypothetical protein
VADRKNAAIHKLINPYKPTAAERALEDKYEINAKWAPGDRAAYEKLSRVRLRAISDNICTKCHDNENDVNFGLPGREMVDKWIETNMFHHTKNTFQKRQPLKLESWPQHLLNPLGPPTIEKEKK